MKKIENKKVEKFLSVIVELIEFVIISLIAIFILEIKFKSLIIILLTFFISRFYIGSPGHYKINNYFDNGWKRCFFWTSSLILSLSLTTKLGILVGMLFTIFTVYTISGKANISDIVIDAKIDINDLTLGYKAKGEPSKYEKLIEYLKFNAISDEYIKAEELLKKAIDTKQFKIYKRIFFDNYTWDKVEEEFDINRLYISRTLDQCYFYLIGRLEL
jgi:hypothetical protein